MRSPSVTPEIPTETEFVTVAVQMLRRNMVERADDATFQQREKAFSVVYMADGAVRIVAGIFQSGMVHNIMAFEPAQDRTINLSSLLKKHIFL